MKQHLIFIFCIITGFNSGISAQVAAVHITLTVPAETGDKQKIYIAGSFNNWHAGDSNYRLQNVSKGIYQITLPLFDGKRYEYKYTTGHWNGVEVALNDSNVSNRSFLSAHGKKISDTVMKWKQPAIQEKKPNPQMDSINARKDAVLAKLQPELDNMQGLLKLYIVNMLQEKPSAARHRRLNKQGEKKLKYAYEEMTGLFWDIFTSLTPEQKKEMLKLIDQPGKDSEFLNTLGNALNKVVQ